MPTISGITFRRLDTIRSILYPGFVFLIRDVWVTNCLCRAPLTSWHSTPMATSGSLNSTLTVLDGSILEPGTCSTILFHQNRVYRPSTRMELCSIGRGMSGSPNRVKINLVSLSQQRERYTYSPCQT